MGFGTFFTPFGCLVNWWKGHYSEVCALAVKENARLIIQK